MPSITKKERQTMHKDHRDKMLRLDYELLNVTLGVEINAQMPIEVVRKVVRTRWAEFNNEERRDIPQQVIDIVHALNTSYAGRSLDKYLKPKPAGRAATTFFQHSGNKATLRIDGVSPGEVVEQIVNHPRWPLWSFYNSGVIKVVGDSVVVESPLFIEFSEIEIRNTIGTFGV